MATKHRILIESVGFLSYELIQYVEIQSDFQFCIKALFTWEVSIISLITEQSSSYNCFGEPGLPRVVGNLLLTVRVSCQSAWPNHTSHVSIILECGLGSERPVLCLLLWVTLHLVTEGVW